MTGFHKCASPLDNLLRVMLYIKIVSLTSGLLLCIPILVFFCIFLSNDNLFNQSTNTTHPS